MNGSTTSTGAGGERGAALLTVILMLVLVSVLAVAFMSLVSGERAMSSNVHVAKGALYAADAGVRMAEQDLANTGKERLDSLVAIHTGGAVIKNPSLLFPKGAIATSATNPAFAASAVISITPADSISAMSSQIYNYNYTITSTGQQGALGKRSVQSTGVLRLSAARGSFSDYVLFTNTHTSPSGGKVWFTSNGYFNGRVHTNTQFCFNGAPTFEDLVTSAGSKAWFYGGSSGSNVELDSDHNGTQDVPNLYGGFKRGQPAITMPANSYGQQNAAIGGDELDTTAPSNATLRAALGLPAGTSAPPNGVYVPNNTTAVTGGIYVQGNVDEATMSVDGFGSQVYTLKQGSTTTTVTVSAIGTFVKVGSGIPKFYSGKPRGILYTKGSMSKVGGPARSGSTVPPALADNTQLLLCASSDIVIQRDITCNDFQDGNSVLGIYSSSKVRIGTDAPDDLNIHAFVMSTGASGSFEVDDYDIGGTRGTVNLKGGVTASFYGLFGQFSSNPYQHTHGYKRNFEYDKRGLIPPYYPTTSVYTANAPLARKLMWKEL